MELRKNIKAPQRYDEIEEYVRSPSTESYRPTQSPPPVREKYLGKIIEYNPNLPPAAFPTLDSWAPRRVDEVSTTSPVAGSIQAPQLSNPPPAMRKPPKSNVLTAPDSSRVTKPMIKPPKMPRFRKSSRNRSISLGSTSDFPDAGNGRWDNGPNNPIYTRNMEIMESLGKRTSEEEFEAEMETSDEELFEPVSGPTQKANTLLTKCPAWEELTVAHQIDLVHTVSESCDSYEEAMLKLRLGSVQVEAMLELLQQHEKVESSEQSRIASLQEETNRILLADSAQHMSQAQFRELAEKHIYSHDAEEFYLSNKAELVKAKWYLQSCGYEPDLLNHWTDGSYQAVSDVGRSDTAKSIVATSQLQTPTFQRGGLGALHNQGLTGQQLSQNSTKPAEKLKQLDPIRQTTRTSASPYDLTTCWPGSHLQSSTNQLNASDLPSYLLPNQLEIPQSLHITPLKNHPLPTNKALCTSPSSTTRLQGTEQSVLNQTAMTESVTGSKPQVEAKQTVNSHTMSEIISPVIQQDVLLDTKLAIPKQSNIPILNDSTCTPPFQENPTNDTPNPPPGNTDKSTNTKARGLVEGRKTGLHKKPRMLAALDSSPEFIDASERVIQTARSSPTPKPDVSVRSGRKRRATQKHGDGNGALN